MAARGQCVRRLSKILTSRSRKPAPTLQLLRSGQRLHPIEAPLGWRPVTAFQHQKRWDSSSSYLEQWKKWDFEMVKKAATSPDSNTVIIDVREPGEYNAGHIPKANNMPITSSPEGLFLSEADFAERFGFPKPRHDTEVVFYCKAGIRSKGAASLAEQAGFKNVGEYRGSWLDWAANVRRLQDEADEEAPEKGAGAESGEHGDEKKL